MIVLIDLLSSCLLTIPNPASHKRLFALLFASWLLVHTDKRKKERESKREREREREGEREREKEREREREREKERGRERGRAPSSAPIFFLTFALLEPSPTCPISSYSTKVLLSSSLPFALFLSQSAHRRNREMRKKTEGRRRKKIKNDPNRKEIKKRKRKEERGIEEEWERKKKGEEK